MVRTLGGGRGRGDSGLDCRTDGLARRGALAAQLRASHDLRILGESATRNSSQLAEMKGYGYSIFVNRERKALK